MWHDAAMRARVFRVSAVLAAVAGVVFAFALPDTCRAATGLDSDRAAALLQCVSEQSRMALRVAVVISGLVVALVLVAWSFPRSAD